MKFKAFVISALLIFVTPFASAQVSGDNVTASYGGWLYDSNTPSPTVGEVGGGSFGAYFVDLFGQSWLALSKIDSGKLEFTFYSPSSPAANASSLAGLVTVNYAFNASSIGSVTLASFSHSSANPGLTSSFDGVSSTGSDNFMLSFNTVHSGDVYLFNLAPVPEPETYAMLLAGLGLMGAVARRRKQKQ